MKRIRGPFSAPSLRIDNSAEVPNSPGIYLWRRRLNFDSSSFSSENEIAQWIKEQAELPIAVLPNLSVSRNPQYEGSGVRSQYLVIDRVTIGGGVVPKATFSSGPKDRQVEAIELLAESMKYFGPILYVGESGNLRQRINEHLSGATGFARRIPEIGLTMDDLHVWLVILENYSTEDRVRFEQLMTHLVGAPLTRKAGG